MFSDPKVRNPEIGLRPIPFRDETRLHYETQLPVGLDPLIPPLGHTVHQPEENKTDPYDWRNPPTDDPPAPPAREPINNIPNGNNNDEIAESDGWGGVDHVPRYPRRTTKTPDRLRDYDCANMVEVMFLSLSIEQEYLNLDSWGKPLSYRTATSGPNASKWHKALSEELERLTEETCTIRWDGYQTISKG